MKIHADLLLILAVFWSLALWTLLSPRLRKITLGRSLGLWALDLVGLSIHGTVVPLFQTVVIFWALSRAFPQAQGILNLPGWLIFALNFIGVDYLYYWNHRLLHQRTLWRFHSVHHSGDAFDLFTTSRNSALTTFLILYVWVNGTLLFMLRDREPYIWAIALSNCLDILRHSRLSAWPEVFPFTAFISPLEHAWHHSRDRHGVNFGGNFNIWDRIHGTYLSANRFPSRIGLELPRSLWAAFWKGAT